MRSTRLYSSVPALVLLVALGYSTFKTVRVENGADGLTAQYPEFTGSKITTSDGSVDENGDLTGYGGSIIAAVDLLEAAENSCVLSSPQSGAEVSTLKTMISEDRFCREVGNTSKAKENNATTNSRPDDLNPPGSNAGDSSSNVNNAGNSDGPSMNLSSETRLEKYEDTDLGELAILAGTLYHEAQHANDGQAAGSARHAEIYLDQIQMLCCILDHIENSTPPYSQQEVDDAKKVICAYIDQYIETYHDFGGTESVTQCCTGVVVSPPPSQTPPSGSTIPLPALSPEHFGPDRWVYNTPVGRFVASVDVVSNSFEVFRELDDSWTLPVATLISTGTFLVTAMSGGLGTDVSLWGEDTFTGESVLLQGTMNWSGSAPVFGSFSEVYRGVDFGDVTALSNLTYAHGKYVVWDYTYATLRWVDSTGGFGTVVSSVEYPELLGRRGMSAGYSVDSNNAIIGYLYSFTEMPGTGNDHADNSSDDWMTLLDYDLDLIPDTKF